jgi:EEF1A N-terminal glycine/lysine methyltransferase
MGVAKALMGSEATPSDEGDGFVSATDADLVMELFNMLVRPGSSFSLRWHRDDIRPDASASEELARLRQPGWHTQWNLALVDDASLVVVPGSHARARTDAERAAADPMAEDGLPGQLVVQLGPGDVVFYNNNILHRGIYDARRERMSLHGSVGHVRGGALRARNVLQHGVSAWVDRCDYLGSSGGGGGVPPRAEAMRARLVRLGRESGEVGYSQEG